MPHPDITAGVEAANTYIERAEAGVNALRIVPGAAFDVVALQLISKAFALSKAGLVLISGFPDEAFGLSRSLVECAMTLRYLTQDPALRNPRAAEFVDYVNKVGRHWCYLGFQQFEGTEHEEFVFQQAEQLGLYDLSKEPKDLRGHWSGVHGFVWNALIIAHPLDSPTTSNDLQRRAQFAVDYDQASSFVHCTQPAVSNYVPEQGVAFRIRPSSGKYQQEGPSTLLRVVYYLHTCIGYGLFGMNLDWPPGLEAEHQTARESIGQIAMSL